MDKSTFVSILYQVKENIMSSRTEDELSNLTDEGFEELFFIELSKMIPKENGEIKYKKKSHAFPDIQIPPYGIEIKTTNSDSWSSLGNSIMEGTRITGVETIYVVFLKRKGVPDIRIKEYEKVVDDIQVTHSPRYHINMEINENDSIFKKIGVPYNEFRKSKDKIKKLRDYYRKQNKQSWWLDPETGQSSTSFEFKEYGSLDKERKKELQIELYALYPEILSSDYSSAASYLISKYGIYDKSFRDKFSASGKAKIKYGDKEILVSKSIERLISLSKDIINFINNNKTLITEVWGMDNEPDNLNLDLIWVKKVSKHIDENSRLTHPKSFDYHHFLIEEGLLSN